MRILIAGDRRHDNVDLIEGVLNELYEAFIKDGRALTEDFVIVHGVAPGADSIASRWADKQLEVKNERHVANWRVFKAAAGPMRNQEMVDLGADVCFAFPKAGSTGTWDCVRKARRAGIPVHIVREK